MNRERTVPLILILGLMIAYIGGALLLKEVKREQEQLEGVTKAGPCRAVFNKARMEGLDKRAATLLASRSRECIQQSDLVVLTYCLRHQDPDSCREVLRQFSRGEVVVGEKGVDAGNGTQPPPGQPGPSDEGGPQPEQPQEPAPTPQAPAPQPSPTPPRPSPQQPPCTVNALGLCVGLPL